MFITAVVLSVLLAFAFGASGGGKAAGNAKLLEGAAHLGYSANAYRAIGAAEIAGAASLLIGLAWAPLGVAAAIGLTLLMIGAAISHGRVKDPFPATAPSVVLAVLAAAAVALRLATA